MKINKKPGTQYFAIDPVDTSVYKSMKVVIKETYGGVKTYLNQVYLYEEIPEIENKKSFNDSKKSISSNAKQTAEIKKVPRDLKNDLLPFNKKEEKETLDRNFDTDSEDSLHNTPQKMNNLHDISRISKDVKQTLKKESFDNSKNYSISLKKDKNIDLDEKAFDGISINSHSIVNIHNKANSIDQPFYNHKIVPNNEDKHNKTLEDQLKDMETHLMKLKLDQSSDNVIKSVLNSNDKFLREKDDVNNKYNTVKKGNVNNSGFNTKDNVRLFIGDDLKKSNSNYSLLTNKIYNYSNDERISKLEKELVEVRNRCDTLQEEVDTLKKSKATVNESNMETILKECKNYIKCLLKNKEENINNSYNTANYNNINDRNGTGNNNNLNFPQKNNYSDHVLYTENRNEENLKQKNVVDKIEKNLANIIESKFDTLAKTIEDKVNNSFLKPSISSIEKTLKSNIEDLREKINSISATQNKLNMNPRQNSTNRDDSEIYEPEKSVNNNKYKLENIQSIAEKLHEKLNEKEKKLALLQQQTNYYLKGKKNILSSPISNISENF